MTEKHARWRSGEDMEERRGGAVAGNSCGGWGRSAQEPTSCTWPVGGDRWKGGKKEGREASQVGQRAALESSVLLCWCAVLAGGGAYLSTTLVLESLPSVSLC